MLTPREVSDKTFDKTFGIGYRMDDVDAYLKQVAGSMSELLEINADLEKKLEVLAQKLNEYREDEESLRTAILGAQKLGDSVIRESKTKAEIITRDATCKAEAMVNNAKRQIEREQENLLRTQREVAGFKNRLLDMYKRHIELISMLPGELEEEREEPAAPAPAAEETEAMDAIQQPEPPAAGETEDGCDGAPGPEADDDDGGEDIPAAEAPEKFFGIDLDDDDYDGDEDDIPYTPSESSRHVEMKFGDAFRIKHKSGKNKFRK